MSALDAALGRARPTKAKKRKSKARAVSTEYNLLLTATLCLLAFGAVMVFSASSTTQVLQNGGLADSAYYLQRTLIVGAIGLVVMHFTARYGLTGIRRLTPVFLAGTMFLLLVVLGAGQSVNGATRWIGGGSFQVQPSELAKVALILYSADLLAREPKRIRSIQGFMPILLVTGAA
ncbi:MAG TPA: FtsW/RodA/SpoVE family cell cycle protein, partial [Solirubrobacterales bacterium]|nr:FtsW/RodA/SpoVE family cell cycle protein [Solirubrobacterales bacterium]